MKTKSYFKEGKNDFAWIDSDIELLPDEFLEVADMQDLGAKKLETSMSFQEMIDKWNPEPVTLGDVAWALRNSDKVLTNGYANFFPVKGREGSVFFLRVNRVSDGWSVYVFRLEYSSRWSAGFVVLFRNSLRPSDTLTLETSSHNDEIEVVESIITKIKYQGKIYKLEE